MGWWTSEQNVGVGDRWVLEVALGCWASAIIYRKTRVYGDYQWIIAINVNTRPLTLQPNATPNGYPLGWGLLEQLQCWKNTKLTLREELEGFCKGGKLWSTVASIIAIIFTAKWKEQAQLPLERKNTLKVEFFFSIHYKVLTHSVITWTPKKCVITRAAKRVYSLIVPPKSVITFGCRVPKRPVAGLPHASDWGEAPATLSITWSWGGGLRMKMIIRWTMSLELQEKKRNPQSHYF